MEKDFHMTSAAVGQDAFMGAFSRPLAISGHETGDAGAHWFMVYKLGDNIFAIYEPNYFQRNYSYLIVGQKQALMIDAGASVGKNIRRTIEALTDKPCAVLPTHLHHDHLGGLPEFEKIWLPDTPSLADFRHADARYFLPTSYIGGDFRNFHLPPFKADRLIADRDDIDLGGVTLKVMHTTGHSREDVAVLYEDANILFVGDYMYPGHLICGNAHAYADSAARLLALTNNDTLLLSAHASFRAVVPVMTTTDLADLKDFLTGLLRCEMESKAFKSPRYSIASAKCYVVNEKMFFLDKLVWSDGSKYGF